MKVEIRKLSAMSWEWLELGRRVLSEMMGVFFIMMVVMQVHTFIKPIQLYS